MGGILKHELSFLVGARRFKLVIEIRENGHFRSFFLNLYAYFFFLLVDVCCCGGEQDRSLLVVGC